MRTRTELDRALRERPAAPRERGTVRVVVARLGDEAHDVLACGRITVAQGLEGDRWARATSPSGDRQITVMEHAVAEWVADGQPVHLPGDNLLVDLDLHEAAAPPGTRLRAGTCLLEVTAAPHRGCKKFEARFGAEALAWVNAPEHAARRLRGINCRVVEAGEVRPGDAIVNLGIAPD
ncbi:MAG: hypothetical protein KDK70_21495 [Myxococcales bacterium]|nr:hypothetical protein [Myxococcales bacterium]